MAIADGYIPLHLWVGGEKLSGNGRDESPVLDPSSEAILAPMPHASAEDIHRALEAAERSFPGWQGTGAWERSAILRKAANLIRERSEAFVRVLSLEEGKPVWESQWEVGATADLIDWAAEEGKRVFGRVMPPRPGRNRAMVLRQPVGPVAAFAPWNLPLFLPGRKIATALAAGCPIIMKPAEETPASCLLLAEAFADAGLPAGVLNVLLGDPATISHALITSEQIRKISFTGSTPVGKKLAALAADGVKRMTMELGGHAPVIVLDDADVDAAVAGSVPYKFMNAGQICISPTRFYLHDSIHDQFVEKFSSATRGLKVGSWFEDHTEMGPLANPRRIDAMERHIGDALRKGAKLETGGERIGNRGYFWQPTVLSNVPEDAVIMNEEPFGPVAAMTRFTDLDEAVARANRLPFGLAAYAFTRSAARSAMLVDRLEAGLVGINTYDVAPPEGPFGGVKQSGYGSEGGCEGLDSHFITKFATQA